MDDVGQKKENVRKPVRPGRGATIYTEADFSGSQDGRRRIGRLSAGGKEIPERSRKETEQSVRAEVHRERKQERETQRRRAETNRPEGDEPSSWQEKLKARKRRRIRRVFQVLLILILIAYTGAAVYFGFHFYEDTEVYGIDCSQKTVEEVKQEVAEKLDDYRLEIQERGGKTETITAGDIGLEFVDNSSIDRMMKAQRCYIWPVMMLMERNDLSSVAFSYDTDRAEKSLMNLDCMNQLYNIPPEDAYIGTTDTGFEVVSEVMGTTLDRDKTVKAVMKALDQGKTVISLEEEGCYVNPEIYQDDEELQKDAAAMSELARAYITLDFGDRQEVIHAPLIREWIVELADGSFVIDDMCVTQYVEDLAVKYDTFGMTREFYTSIGTTVTLTGGDYGWCIDQDATVVKLLNAMAEGYQGTMEPEYIYTGMCRDTNDIGYTYVEICISQQRMWCYQDGNLIVDTPVVTGNPNKGNGTPSGGVWAIDAKKRNAVLVGEGYQAPVDYWMPFNEDVGIHDLKTRAYFGGTIYLTNGSHGCVNTPYDQVQIIYNAVSVGTPVIVYE
ncbi:MAG: peptidoglycan binding domain-containing protein [Candidatus Choladocola sp.]|nr:peptidoglycan binding domain-containing protein [Candidatus Choladocola sp.]